jgi:nucleoside-diphosphate-sugar epimerase
MEGAMSDSFGLPRIACVTGASGMIGRRIVSRLLARGFRVRVLSRQIWSDLSPGVDFFHAGLSDMDELEQFVVGADMLFHCAAELMNVSKMHETNVLGSQRIATLVARHGLRYFCYISSAGVVGATTQKLVDESTVCNPNNEYEKTKLEAELQVRKPIVGCSTVILRPTNVVDENHLGELALPRNLSWRSRIKAFVKGGECAHIVHAEDVADAALYFADRPSEQVQLFFVSLDHDPRNTVAHLWGLYRAFQAGGYTARALPHLPPALPYWLRRLSGHPANPGTVRYSSARLLASGFRFSHDVAQSVERIVADHKAGCRHAHS